MKEDTIIQFVCFITDIKPDKFIPGWDRYAKKLDIHNHEPGLQHLAKGNKSRYRYVSQHELPGSGFNFSFMEERKSENFPELSVKVIQAGGYTPLPSKKKFIEKDNNIKLLAFIGHNEYDIAFYSELNCFNHIIIYKAYFESCLFGYIIEFFVSPQDMDQLVDQLKQRPDIETGVYEACLVPHL